MKSGFQNRLMKLAGEPLVHFFMIGALIYAAYAYTGGPVVEDDERSISITAGEITWLQDVWEKKWNRAPTQKELQGIVKQFLRERVLASEATAMGLDREDVVIRRRLAQKLEYLSQDLLGGGTPSDEDIAAFFAGNAKAYEVPAVLTLSHVYFDPDKRGAQALEEAKTQKPVLASLKVPPEDSRGYGDPFLLQGYYPERTYAELAKLFGGGFVETLTGLSVGEWHGPVRSGLGFHLIRLDSRTPGRLPELAEIRPVVDREWSNERRLAVRDEMNASLLEGYDVVIEWPEIATDSETASQASVR